MASVLPRGGIAGPPLSEIRYAAVRKATAIKVDIGGDAIYWGRPPLSTGWRVGIADPLDPSDDGSAIAVLNLQGMAIAGSGHASRYREIGGQRFSHILDPATGWAVEQGKGSGVVALAPTAAGADAAATAMSIQSAREAADWASALPELDGLALEAGGTPLVSYLWHNYVAEQEISDAEAVLRLDYTLPSFMERGSYNRPYLAIWISDTGQKPLRHLLMLGEDERWARDNTRWWRRVGRDNPGLLRGLARPTRAPGEYRLNWDGLDETGNPLPPGTYLLHIEAARQDGGHDYQSLRFALGGPPQSEEIAESGELGRIRLQVGK